MALKLVRSVSQALKGKLQTQFNIANLSALSSCLKLCLAVCLFFFNFRCDGNRGEVF